MRIRAENFLIGLLAVGVACKSSNGPSDVTSERPDVGAPQTPSQETPVTLTRPAPTDHLPGLTDEAFWSGLDLEPAKEALEASGSEALQLDGPHQVDLEARDNLPLVALHQRSLARDRKLDRDRQAILVGIDLAGGALRVEPALASGKMPAEPSGKMPAEPSGKMPAEPSGNGGSSAKPPQGRILDAFELDARRVLDLPWTAGAWQLFVIVADQRSNPVVVTLGDGNGSGSEAELSSPDLDADEAKHPAPPSEPGVALKLPAAATTNGEAPIWLTGSVRSTRSRPALVHLLAVTDGPESAPFSISFEVPVEALPDGGYAGTFALDLRTTDGLPLRPTTWHYYGFSSGSATDPATVQLSSD